MAKVAYRNWSGYRNRLPPDARARAAPPPKAAFYDGFEDGNIEEWTGEKENFKVQQNLVAEGDYALRVSGLSLEGIRREVEPPFTGDYARFFLRASDVSEQTYVDLGYGPWIQIRDGNIEYRNVRREFVRVTDAEADRWYEIELKDIDYTNNSCELWIDGRKMANITFNPVSEISYVRLNGYRYPSGVEGYFDSVQLGGG